MTVGGPLRIDTVTTPGGGVIGMIHCPGRCVAPWHRDLATDLEAIKAWNADILVSLIETHEFHHLGVPDLGAAARHAGIDWRHVPIRDMGVPDGAFARAWADAGPAVMDTLERGGRIIVHCAAGMGRTGTIAAKLLAGLGVPVDAAIARVRAARPGTIETADQEGFVRSGPPLFPIARRDEL